LKNWAGILFRLIRRNPDGRQTVMIMKKSRFALVFAILTAALPVWPAVAQQKTVIRFSFASPPTTNWLPYFVAKKKGWLDAAGLDVQETFMTSDPNALRALLSQQADLAAVGTFPPYLAVLEGAQIKAIGSFFQRIDYEILARDNIKSIKDMEGARIATSTPGAASGEIPKLVMRKHGFDPSKASVVPIGSHEARMMAIAADKVDAAAVPALYAAKASTMAGMHSLANVAEEFPQMGHFYILARSEDLAIPAKRAAFVKFLKVASVDANRYIVANPEQAAKIMMEYLPEFDEKLITDAIKSLTKSHVWAVNGGAEPEVTAFTIKTGVELGAIPKSLEVKDILDTSLVDEVLRDSGRQ
jgi:ABC-type nitrate/sulfonate/bicarbonate transport system substrate-binding protein